MTVDQSARHGAATTRVSGVPVVHWNPVRDGAPVANFGDLLGPELVSRMVAGRDPAPTDGTPRALVSVGSVLHLAPEHAVVWGTGVNGKNLSDRDTFPGSLDVRSVRGPWTRRYLRWLGHDVPDVYGDPALLLPYLMPEVAGLVRAPRRDALFVPNLNDRDELSAQARILGVLVQDPRDQIHSVLAQIAVSRFVVGSSLHAVVVAEALGVPARFVASEHEHPFKYRDYLAGTGRCSEPVARTLEDALALGPMPEPRYDADAILDVFPHDLWMPDSNGGADPPRPVPLTTPGTADALLGAAAVGHLVGDTDWVTSLSTKHEITADVARYEANLREAVESVDTAVPAGMLDRLTELRQWFYPDVRSDQLAVGLRDADRAVLSGSAEHFVSGVRRADTGLAACAYAAFRQRSSTVLSFFVQLVDSARPIEEARLVNGNAVVVVSGMVLPNGAAQLDLDIIVPVSWGDPRDLDLVLDIDFADGATESTPLAWANQMPRLDQTGAKTMVAAGQEGA
ncbi:polysaccharide pyruvyl transferase family protein [Promicromonospora sp. NPDC090134]|uniref:polysaccharide pyruvyl transferase family protein n=1 Tax=Promicromonospora sp. NPDC090134 TaxID=3364408 RepID=UPI00381A7ACE